MLFFLGFLNGSLTSGTGLFVTIWLVLWFGMDYQRAVAYTLIMVGLFWNGSGAVTLGPARRYPLGLAAGFTAGLAIGRLPGLASRHPSWQPLDQTRL